MTQVCVLSNQSVFWVCRKPSCHLKKLYATSEARWFHCCVLGPMCKHATSMSVPTQLMRQTPCNYRKLLPDVVVHCLSLLLPDNVRAQGLRGFAQGVQAHVYKTVHSHVYGALCCYRVGLHCSVPCTRQGTQRLTLLMLAIILRCDCNLSCRQSACNSERARHLVYCEVQHVCSIQ